MTIQNQLLSGSSINGTIVENRNGDNIGNIKDVMIDTRTGEVAYAVLSVDTGFLNLGSKYFAVPLQALKFDFDNKRILMDIKREQLENAPGFDKDNWPSGPQSEFIGLVYDFYEVERSNRFSAEMPSNRNSTSGNAANQLSSGGYRNGGDEFQHQSFNSGNFSVNNNKSIH